MAIEYRGTITTWNDTKGFGFITPEQGGRTVFFHVSECVNHHTRPHTNVSVRYTLAHDEHNRPRAIQIRFAHATHTSSGITLCVVSLFFLLLAFATMFIPIPIWILLLYMISSSLTFGLYALDKASAIQKAWRIPEDTLHVFEFAGGWPGALIAQTFYHHKSTKATYQAEFWLIVVLNLTFLIGYGVFRLLTKAN